MRQIKASCNQQKTIFTGKVITSENMEKQPEVSIIMNCLNCEKDLPVALESVASQTFNNWEIIFWDNGSTDNSPNIAQAFGSKLRYFCGEKTVPLGAARNLAISRASGKYIAFLDCDDLWKPEKLERQLKLFQVNPKIGLVSTDTEILEGNKVIGRVFERGTPARGRVFEELMTRQWISMSSAMISREALESSGKFGHWFDENLELCEEADLFYRIAHDWELNHVDKPLTVWRVHGKNSTFRNFEKFGDETLIILNKHRKLYPDYDKNHTDLVKLLEKRALFQKAVGLWKKGRNGEARKLVQPYLKESRKYQLFWAASFLPGSFFNILARLYFSLPGKF